MSEEHAPTRAPARARAVPSRLVEALPNPFSPYPLPTHFSAAYTSPGSSLPRFPQSPGDSVQPTSQKYRQRLYVVSITQYSHKSELLIPSQVEPDIGFDV